MSDVLTKFCIAIGCSGMVMSDDTCLKCRAYMLDRFMAFAEDEYWEAEREGIKEG